MFQPCAIGNSMEAAFWCPVAVSTCEACRCAVYPTEDAVTWEHAFAKFFSGKWPGFCSPRLQPRSYGACYTSLQPVRLNQAEAKQSWTPECPHFQGKVLFQKQKVPGRIRDCEVPWWIGSTIFRRFRSNASLSVLTSLSCEGKHWRDGDPKGVNHEIIRPGHAVVLIIPNCCDFPTTQVMLFAAAPPQSQAKPIPSTRRAGPTQTDGVRRGGNSFQPW